MIKHIIAGLVLATAAGSVVAGPTEQTIAGVLLNQVFNEMRDSRNRNTAPPATAAIAYPVPVHQPPTIVIPQCTPNVMCPTAIVIHCTSLPIFDAYGRIISYHQVCR